ncbi:MAG: hypothetical protein NC311_03215 [Muribaculaceae bacterium]|nr:hypothetical protein [Muribaculaceae bacterium]
MKYQMSLFVWAVAVFGMSPVFGATNYGTRAASSADLSGAPAVRERNNVNYEKYQTRTTTRVYETEDAGNLYYTQPVKRSDLYKQYDNGAGARTVRTSRAETVRSEMRRKYFLAHPFFQPLKGKFGSVTDLSYTMNNYKMDLTPFSSVTLGDNTYSFAMDDTSAKWDMTQFSIKEDFSYGITDKIAILGMVQYDMGDYKLDWSVAPDDKMDDNGLNMYGIGPQWRFVDNDNWIATASAYYQRQKDISNNFVLELKAGYKVASTTIYGLARGWYVSFDENSYGNGIEGITKEGNTSSIFVAYKTDADDAFYVEGGLGVFSVLEEDWTLNVEAIFGDYDWHNQASIKAAIGWQPNDWFALNLYAKTSLYDSADDKTLGFYGYGWTLTDVNSNEEVMDTWIKYGDAKLSDYRETTIGLQAIFMF